VVLTDGADTASAYSPEQVSAIASAVDVPVYVFVMATMTREGEKVPFEAERRSTLANLARATGGDFFVAYDTASTTAAINQLVEELRHQYVLAFEASPEHGWRNVQVAPARRGSWSAHAAGISPAPPSNPTDVGAAFRRLLAYVEADLQVRRPAADAWTAAAIAAKTRRARSAGGARSWTT
jgi:hypothetical protein